MPLIIAKLLVNLQRQPTSGWGLPSQLPRFALDTTQPAHDCGAANWIVLRVVKRKHSGVVKTLLRQDGHSQLRRPLETLTKER